MQCNENGIQLIRSFEGCKLKAYQDEGGVWTVGFGQTGPFVKEGLEITQDQADAWLYQSVQNTADKLSRMIKWPLSGNQFSSLVSLAYNIGTGAFGESTALKNVNKGLLAAVPSGIVMWNKINGKVSEGLMRRRNAECRLFNTPD